MIIERTRAGVEAARKRSVRPGPKKKLTRQQIEHAQELRKKGKPPALIADILSVSRSTLYRALAG